MNTHFGALYTEDINFNRAKPPDFRLCEFREADQY